MSLTLNAKKIFASVLEASGALRVLSSGNPAYRVLIYHRVIDPAQAPFPLEPGMYVRPEVFRTHLNYLAKQANVVSLFELCKHATEGRKIKPRTVAITFDDGWRDNFENAFPLLKEFSLPATIFLPTKFIGKRELFWTDVVALAVDKIANLPTSEAEGLLKSKSRSEHDNVLLHSILQLVSIPRLKTMDHKLLHVLGVMKRFSEAQREAIVETLLAFLNPELEKLPPQFLDWSNVNEMAKAGITFGSHSHAHRLASEVNKAEFEKDLTQSEEVFKTEDIDALPIYCFPSGLSTKDAAACLKARNYLASLGTEPKTTALDGFPLVGRIGMHNDVSERGSLFASRLWLPHIF